MGRRKTDILSFSVPPEMKKEFKELAAEQGMGASELFREMVRVYEDYQAEKKFRVSSAMVRSGPGTGSGARESCSSWPSKTC